MKSMPIHASCVAIQDKAILICGVPGAGKSSLALQLIDRGAILIADDQTFLTLEEGQIVANAPPSLKGLIEVRGVGICSFSYQEKSPLELCVELCEESQLERLPNPAFVEYHGMKVPLLKLIRHDPLGAIKVELRLCHLKFG